MSRPTVVSLCGSTRFWREFQKQNLRLTLEGVIVLSIGAATGTDDEHFGNLPAEEYDRIKRALDDLHLRKIDLSDEILVLNVDGYVGDSTRREIVYAGRGNKTIRWLQPMTCPCCKGLGGFVGPEDVYECALCHGSGRVGEVSQVEPV